MTEISSSSIYLGSRGEDFKALITSMLEKGSLKPKYISRLTDEKAMEAYGIAFTAFTADKEKNYERFEQIGDVAANKFIVCYSYRRFPQLDCTLGVKVVARLRINYGAKVFFSTVAEKLGFWPFISAGEDGTEPNKHYRKYNKRDLLEDVLEAFIGCTEYLLDKAYRPGVGYGIIYDILSNIFDEIPMSLAYEDLMDPKTRLKETFDLYKELGDWAYLETVGDVNVEGFRPITSNIYFRLPEKTNKKKFDPKTWVYLCSGGKSNTKIGAQQNAAIVGIEKLKSIGYYKHPPSEYQFFCT
jgi:dsRNA-specific ribonuclease